MLSGLADPVSAQHTPHKQPGSQKPFLPPKPRDPLQQEFAPIPNGPGIQICKPVAPENDAALGDFGDGCGLWLQWAMGFHPELGQTPRWELAMWARRQFHLPRLRLSLAQGSRLVNLLGVTHVAVGQIGGTPTKCLLTYQLYAVPAQKAVGAPLRLARVCSGLSAQEAETLEGIYAHWVYAAARTTEIAPDYQAAWHALASAATFVGNPERADAAFWKAYALDKSDLGLYVWGLEMYQSKWGGDPRTLAKAAHLAAQAVFPPNSDLFSLGVEFRSAGFPADAKTMFARAIAQEREIVRQYPNDSGVHAALGYYLADMQQNAEAETELKTALRLAPNSRSAHSYLGRLYRVTERYPEAVREYRDSVRLTAWLDSACREWYDAIQQRSGRP